MQRWITRPVAVAVGCVLLAGVGIGAAMAFGARYPAKPRAMLDRPVVSRWSGGGVRLVFGSLAADPGRGFVRLKGRHAKPGFFTTPEGAGALRLVSHDKTYSWTFRSSHGALAFLSSGFEDVPPSFEFLGRKLDPAKLGPIGSRGVAVPINWWVGKKRRDAVVLVEQMPSGNASFGGRWQVAGYLPGFMTPGRAAEWSHHFPGPWTETVRALQQPLLGPDGKSYSIDVNGERLVRVGGSTPAVTLKPFKLGDCTTWPGSNGASYRACGSSITLRRAHGPAATVFRRPGDDMFGNGGSWTFVQRSPNGRWLLLEEANETCSYYTKAAFLPARGGGRLALVFPGSSTDSEALGWLPDNTALVAGQPQTCGGNGPAGIYQIRPGTASSPSTYQLVFATNFTDATSWGFGH